MRETDIGGRLILDIKRRRRITLLKFESVRPVRLCVRTCPSCHRKIWIAFRSAGWFLLTGKEAVELHQELEVDIVALWRLAVGVSDVMAVEIDT